MRGGWKRLGTTKTLKVNIAQRKIIPYIIKPQDARSTLKALSLHNYNGFKDVRHFHAGP